MGYRPSKFHYLLYLILTFLVSGLAPLIIMEIIPELRGIIFHLIWAVSSMWLLAFFVDWLYNLQQRKKQVDRVGEFGGENIQ